MSPRKIEQVAVQVDGAHDGAQEGEELQVRVRLVARVEQVRARVRRHGPVVVLARAVDAGERLLVQDHLQAVLRRDAAHGLHDQHLVVAGDVRRLEHGGELELAGRDLVVARLDRHAQAIQLLLDLGHEAEDARRDRAEVVILHLLALGRLRAEERPIARHEVGPHEVQVAIDEEVLLLAAERRVDARDALVGAEQAQDAHGLRRERVDRAQERRLLVERHTGPRDERGRDDHGHVVLAAHEERRARRVPGRVAAGLERRAQAARRERGRVGLGLQEVGAREAEDRAALAVRDHERVVLLGGRPGQRLEPVRVVRRAVLEGPGLHGGGDHVGLRAVEAVAVADRLDDRLRQARGHLRVAEHVRAVGVDGVLEAGAVTLAVIDPRVGGVNGFLAGHVVARHVFVSQVAGSSR
jgi:hypothetical protein